MQKKSTTVKRYRYHVISKLPRIYKVPRQKESTSRKLIFESTRRKRKKYQGKNVTLKKATKAKKTKVRLSMFSSFFFVLAIDRLHYSKHRLSKTLHFRMTTISNSSSDPPKNQESKYRLYRYVFFLFLYTRY